MAGRGRKTIDWEGAYVSRTAGCARRFRRALGRRGTLCLGAHHETVGLTAPHLITQAVRKGDELAVHLYAWCSLAKAGGIEPKLSPSFLTGTDKLLEFEDGDVGFDTDLDAYGVTELRVLLRTSRRLLEQTHLPVSKTFRAGGYLGTPKVLQAIREEGFAVDSSATDFRQLDERKDEVLPKRIQAIWPGAFRRPNRGSSARRAALRSRCRSPRSPTTHADDRRRVRKPRTLVAEGSWRDVFVVVGFHQETAHDSLVASAE
jgi:predicted deacetylase